MTLLPDHPIPHTPGSSAAATTLVMNGSISPDTAPIHAQTQQVLLSTQSGSLALLTPLDEQSYRRLSALQTHFHSSGEHTCGLNPRAYRAVESDGFGSRGVIDGGLLVRGWAGLGARARAEAGGKVGVEGWILRGDLEGVGRVSGF